MANGMVLTPRLSAAWHHGFGDLTPTAALAFAATTDGDFTVTGVPLSRDSALIDAKLEVSIGQNVSLGVSYLGQLSSASSSNAVRGHLIWTF
jgi:outer membrane autotransporter protein